MEGCDKVAAPAARRARRELVATGGREIKKQMPRACYTEWL